MRSRSCWTLVTAALLALPTLALAEPPTREPDRERNPDRSPTAPSTGATSGPPRMQRDGVTADTTLREPNPVRETSPRRSGGGPDSTARGAGLGMGMGAGRWSADSLRARAGLVAQATRTRVDDQVKAAMAPVDRTGGTDANAVARRLAGEFGVHEDSLAALRARTGASWGDLMVAYTLAANMDPGDAVTPQMLLEAHATGMGWGTIAAGLDLRVGEVVSAVQAEARVARGLAQADGKVAVIGRGATSATPAGTRRAR